MSTIPANRKQKLNEAIQRSIDNFDPSQMQMSPDDIMQADRNFNPDISLPPPINVPNNMPNNPLNDLTTRQEAIRYQLYPITQNTISYKLRSKTDKRSQRLKSILDGDPSKGTVVIACRGTDSSDGEDFAVDARMFGPPIKLQGKEIIAENPPSFNGDPYYERTKNHILNILNTDFKPTGSNQSYKDFWDVFITGHSLGGALTDQLLIDQVGKGGISFNGPRTQMSNQRRENVFSIINAKDRVVGLSTRSGNNKFDYVASFSKSLINPTNHMLDQLGPLTGRDGLPLFNDHYFGLALTKDLQNQNSKLPLLGSGFVGSGSEVTRKSEDLANKGLRAAIAMHKKQLANEDYETEEKEFNELQDLWSDYAFGLPVEARMDVSEGSAELMAEADALRNQVDKMQFEKRQGRGMNDLTGEGPAPTVETFRKLAKDVYDKQEPIKNGLLLPQYTLRKPNGKSIVNFYIYTTPQPYDIYASMPVYNTIKVQLDTLFGVGKIDKSFQMDTLWK